ncbi:hypothetical protein SAMN05661012_00766 [Chitinophaga sancti]|uniref:Uncharacterized protein n=1 Tax=Chitinophaga sancti TaxID=1004 RepID=A0A1K1MPH7_9BACT|nr:hypothetical protein SAMN05661012_00766 [Chitinophaga sancti]
MVYYYSKSNLQANPIAIFLHPEKHTEPDVLGQKKGAVITAPFR